MTPANIHDLATAPTGWRNGAWWEREAVHAYARGDFLIIPGRNDDDVYMARFWLSFAIRRASESTSGEAIESGDSLLLHFFARGDDDQALHDHPWDFRTTILRGGYDEHLPYIEWMPSAIDCLGDGPAWDARVVGRYVNQTIEHRATDLHCVGNVQPGTWTAVRTGKRVREWGFHPPGQRWQPYREFLKAKKAMA